MNMAQALLLGARTDELRAYLQLAKVKRPPTRKQEMAERICELWEREPETMLQLLSPDERNLLAEQAYADGGHINLAAFNAKYKTNLGYSSAPHYDTCRPLCPFIAYDPYGTLTLVEGVQERLQALLPKPPPVSAKSLSVPPHKGVWTFKDYNKELQTLHRDLLITDTEYAGPVEARRMLQLAAGGKIKVGAATYAPAAATKDLLAQALAAPEFSLSVAPDEVSRWHPEHADPGPLRASVWPILLRQCGWVKAQGSTLALTKSGKDYLAHPTWEAYAAAFERWKADDEFDEFQRVTAIRGQSGRRGRMQAYAPSLRRMAITARLAHLPPGTWITVEEFHRFMRASGHDCTVTANGYALYFTSPQYGTLQGWETAMNAVYLRLVLLESLAVLGLVNVAYAPPQQIFPGFRDCWGKDELSFIHRADGVYALSLTALGAYCLGTRSDYAPPRQVERRLFRVLPNHDLVLLEPQACTVADKALLGRFAIPTADAVWRLDRHRILDSMANGATVDEIRGEITGAAADGLPEPVVQFLDDIGRKQDRVEAVAEALLVTFTDAATAKLVLSEPAIRKLALPAGENGLVIRRSNQGALRSALRKMGMLLP